MKNNLLALLIFCFGCMPCIAKENCEYYFKYGGVAETYNACRQANILEDILIQLQKMNKLKERELGIPAKKDKTNANKQ